MTMYGSNNPFYNSWDNKYVFLAGAKPNQRSWVLCFRMEILIQIGRQILGKVGGTAQLTLSAKSIELNSGFMANSGVKFSAEVGGYN